MLIESIIRKTLGLKRHCVKKVGGDTRNLAVWLVADGRFKPVSSRCGAKGAEYDTLGERRWRYVPVWEIPVTLVYTPRRVACESCGVKVEAIPFGPRARARFLSPLVWFWRVALGLWPGM